MTKKEGRKAINCFVDAELKKALEIHSETYGISQGAIINQLLRAAFAERPAGSTPADDVAVFGEEMISLISQGGNLTEAQKIRIRKELQKVIDQL